MCVMRASTQSSPRVGRRRRRVLLKAMACVHCVVFVYVCVRVASALHVRCM